MITKFFIFRSVCIKSIKDLFRDPFEKPGPLSSTVIVTFSKFFSIRIFIKLFSFEKETHFVSNCQKLEQSYFHHLRYEYPRVLQKINF